jgi:hypothetical protein
MPCRRGNRPGATSKRLAVLPALPVSFFAYGKGSEAKGQRPLGAPSARCPAASGLRKMGHRSRGRPPAAEGVLTPWEAPAGRCQGPGCGEQLLANEGLAQLNT